MNKLTDKKIEFETDDGENILLEVGDTLIMNYENKELQIPDQTELTVTGFGHYLGGLAVEFTSEYFHSSDDPQEDRTEDHIIDSAFETMYIENSILIPHTEDN